MNIELPFERIPASENPLSADVIVIKQGGTAYIFDVGESDEAYDYINQIEEKKVVILSHFHRDHCFNLSRLKVDEIYGGKETIKHTKTGVIVRSEISLSDDIRLIPLPSSHCKGCIALLYKDFLFVGDALYPGIEKGNEKFNPQIMDNTIKTLENIDFKYFCISHRKLFVNPKEAIMRWLSFTREHI
ncbi:MAG: MBL fold metallo-hydrolase [Bacilli bacterium]|nr:MBL fold metallo-hydrolase [Bacilli bacterium]